MYNIHVHDIVHGNCACLCMYIYNETPLKRTPQHEHDWDQKFCPRVTHLLLSGWQCPCYVAGYDRARMWRIKMAHWYGISLLTWSPIFGGNLRHFIATATDSYGYCAGSNDQSLCPLYRIADCPMLRGYEYTGVYGDTIQTFGIVHYSAHRCPLLRGVH